MKMTMKLEFLKPDLTTNIQIPFFEGGIYAGFPSPAADFEELKVSLDKLVTGKSPSTVFYARVNGSSMKDAGIFDKGILVIDRLKEPRDGQIAVCVINSEYTLKRLKVEKDCVWLMPENEDFKPILVTESDDFTIWGIVTYCLNSY